MEIRSVGHSVRTLYYHRIVASSSLGRTAQRSTDHAPRGFALKPQVLQELWGSGATGKERTVVKGEPFPPTPKPGQGFGKPDVTKH